MADTRVGSPGPGRDTGDGLLLRPGLLVRLEGLAAFVLAVWWFAAQGGNWVLFVVLFLVPDVAMLGYLAGPRVGAASYNLVHTYTTAGIITGLGIVTGRGLVVSLGLILVAHIGIDRLLGWGLKYPTAFKDTHLQRL